MNVIEKKKRKKVLMYLNSTLDGATLYGRECERFEFARAQAN